tara:strand:+ start:3305 stop:4087 length:783 start_codon:yes stop_codon:yes gene_type:complete
MEKELIIIKFGGSLITDKSSDTPKINNRNLESISNILNQSKYDLIIVHGAGSFGHPIAKKFNIAKGLNDDVAQKNAIKETRKQVRELNQIFCDSLHKVGIKTETIVPSSLMTTNGPKEIVNFPYSIFSKALSENKIPVTFGDVTDDKLQGISILSGDILMMKLAEFYKPSYSVFIMDYPGVFDGKPDNPDSKIIPVVNQETIEILKKQKENKNIADVTGGLIGKIECAIEMSKYGDTWITNLDSLNDFLNNKPSGSRVII